MNQSRQTTPSDAAMDDLAHQALARIEQIEAAGYAFPKRFSRADWFAAGALIVTTGVWLVAGAWL